MSKCVLLLFLVQFIRITRTDVTGQFQTQSQSKHEQISHQIGIHFI